MNNDNTTTMVAKAWSDGAGRWIYRGETVVSPCAGSYITKGHAFGTRRKACLYLDRLIQCRFDRLCP